MLIAKFLREVDAELKRLQAARNTIAAILATRPSAYEVPSGVPVTLPRRTRASAPLVTHEEPVASPEPRTASLVPPARRRGRPRGSVNRFPSESRTGTRRAPEPTALTTAVTKGPVFVSAAELERQRRQPIVIAAPSSATKPTPHEGTLESLIREVQERRASAA